MTERALLHLRPSQGKVDVVDCETEVVRQTEAVKRRADMATGDTLLAVDVNPAGQIEASIIVVNNPMPVRSVFLSDKSGMAPDARRAELRHQANASTDPTLKPAERARATGVGGFRSVAMGPVEAENQARRSVAMEFVA